jgi:hypothetical protein
MHCQILFSESDDFFGHCFVISILKRRLLILIVKTSFCFTGLWYPLNITRNIKTLQLNCIHKHDAKTISKILPVANTLIPTALDTIMVPATVVPPFSP